MMKVCFLSFFLFLLGFSRALRGVHTRLKREGRKQIEVFIPFYRKPHSANACGLLYAIVWRGPTTAHNIALAQWGLNPMRSAVTFILAPAPLTTLRGGVSHVYGWI